MAWTFFRARAALTALLLCAAGLAAPGAALGASTADRAGVTGEPVSTTTAVAATARHAAQPSGAGQANPAPAVASAARSGWLDDTPRIAIISAFAPELTLLRAELQQSRSHRVNGIEFTTGVLRDRPVVMFLSGISMVNAAMTTQLLLDRFPVTHVLFSGIAGGVNPGLHIGDVNVPQRWGQHLEVLMARETAPQQYDVPPGKAIADLPPFGMLYHRDVRVVSEQASGAQFWFDADPTLLAMARRLGDVSLQQCDQGNVCLRSQPRLVVGGNGVSGTAFVDNAAYRDHLFRVFQANVVDMESAACAMVAQANQVPFLAFRSVSDLAGGGPGANEMHTFLNIAAENSARVLLAFLAQWEDTQP